MKKSAKSLSLVLMGSLTLGLSGCAEEPVEEFKAYNSIDECVKEQIFTEQECKETAIAAVQQNPQFANQAECEREFGEGNCQSFEPKGQAGEERGSSWMPLMAGYMIGRYMGGGSFMQGAQPLYKQPQPAAGAQPGAAATRASGGFGNSFRTLGGTAIQADATGKVANPPQAVREGFTKSAKPHVARSGMGTRGGFSGSKGFGSAAS